MMAGLIVDGGEIPLRYFEKRSYDLTFKVIGARLSFRDLFEGLCGLLHEDDISDIGKVDSNTYNVTVASPEAADILNMYGSIKVRDRTYQVISIAKQSFEFRVHWLPSYIKDTFLEDFFSRFGKVTSVIREAVAFGPNATKRTSVRRIMIETDEMRKRSLPYVITFTGGYTALITVPGRPPLCLRCKTIGHLRKDCVPQGTSYADKAKGGSNDGPSDSSNVNGANIATDLNGGGGDVSIDTSSADGSSGGQAAMGGGEATGDGSGGDGRVIQGDVTSDVLDLSGGTQSTGNTIPPNLPVEKRSADDIDDDDLMPTDELEWQTSGKRLKGKS